MNVLFLSLLGFQSFSDRNIYCDLLREFLKDGHKVYCISPVERKASQPTKLIQENNGCILKLQIGNIQKVNILEKGISTLMIEPQFIRGIKKYFSEVKFDLVLYATPPITFEKVIRFVKKRDQAKSYLMLKDIFPQNSVDLGMLSKQGIKGIIYRFFRAKEKRLYAVSDTIGCMSQANCDYLLKHNKEVAPTKVEICPNCMEPIKVSLTAIEKQQLREKYGLPYDKTILVYGGNLGRPQDIPFVVACLKACADIQGSYFLLVGSGTDRHYLEEYVEKEHPAHVKLMEKLPKQEYDQMIACCDVGLIFLDKRFTIPNFPSRLLSYMQASMPVLACTDTNTDIGKVITDNIFGWWCESNSVNGFRNQIEAILRNKNNLERFGNNGMWMLENQYHAEQAYKIIAMK